MARWQGSIRDFASVIAVHHKFCNNSYVLSGVYEVFLGMTGVSHVPENRIDFDVRQAVKYKYLILWRNIRAVPLEIAFAQALKFGEALKQFGYRKAGGLGAYRSRDSGKYIIHNSLPVGQAGGKYTYPGTKKEWVKRGALSGRPGREARELGCWREHNSRTAGS
ncbi:hypothetical protein F5888DRAFT_1638200 [Russula emetica]|nr:hypothetical protein F5888DRAFT_1638200 [Russula emetica]